MECSEHAYVLSSQRCQIGEHVAWARVIMLLQQCSAASTSSALGPDWDVEAEIARELQELADEASAVSVACPQELARHLNAAAGDAAPVEALWAALSAGDHLAAKLTATLHELKDLPQPKPTSQTRVPDTASAQQVSAAVAALSRFTGAGNQLQAGAPCTYLQLAASKSIQQQHEQTQVPPVLAQPTPGISDLQSAAHLECQHLSTQPEHAIAAEVPKQGPDGATYIDRTSVPAQQQQQPQEPAEQQLQEPPAVSASPVVVAAAAQGKPEQPPGPTDPASGQPAPSRPQLSPPHTPNTEDKRQHAAAALLAHHTQQQEQQDKQRAPPCLLIESSSEEATDAAQTLCTSAPEVPVKLTAAPPAAAAAAAPPPAAAAEEAAAAAAAQQRQQEQSKVQQLLQQQVRQ